MNYIFTMTVSGTCIYLAYMLIRRIVGDRLAEKWYYMLLKVTVVYFLIPLPFLKQFYIWVYETWSGKAWQLQVMYYAKEDMVVFKGEGFLYLNDTAKLQGTILLFWTVGVLGIAAWFLADYIQKRRFVERVRVEEEPRQEEKVFREELCRRLQVCRQVKFINRSGENSPFTIGFCKPVVFYDFAAPKEQKELFLAHELIHIQRGDMVWRFLGILVKAMHWYNPLAWTFVKELEKVCEYSCDELAIQGGDDALRHRYVQILINYQTEKGAVLRVNLTREGEETKKRMKKVLNKTKKLSVAVSATIVGTVVALNSLTVFAYEDVKVARGEIFADMAWIEGDLALIPAGEEVVWKNPDYVDNYVYRFDTQFVDVDGNVYEVHENVDTYAVCVHEYVEGMLQQHQKNSDGSCRVYFYNATYCKKCGNISEKEYLGDSGYPVCPH